MEQRETEQRNGTNGIEMERILAWHGYHSPVPVGEGSFSQVYRVTDSSGEFRACRVSDVTEQWQRECETLDGRRKGLSYHGILGWHGSAENAGEKRQTYSRTC